MFKAGWVMGITGVCTSSFSLSFTLLRRYEILPKKFSVSFMFIELTMQKLSVKASSPLVLTSITAFS